MYVYRITEVRSRNHCYGEKAISITYSKCVSVAVVIRHSKPMSLSGSTKHLRMIS